MINQRKWLSTFISILELGNYVVQIVDDTNIWVTGKKNIKILLDVNERKVKSILKNVLYVPHLKQNLFYVGAASTGI